LSHTINDINLNDEIGHTRVVWQQQFFNKNFNRIFYHIGINKKGYFRIYRSDSSGLLMNWGEKHYDKLSFAILAILNNSIKVECRMKHSPWELKNTIRVKRKGIKQQLK
jgi:hypothetical protein